MYTHMTLTHRSSKIQKNRLWYITVILTQKKQKTVNERASGLFSQQTLSLFWPKKKGNFSIIYIYLF